MINRGYTYCAKYFIVGHISRVYHPWCGMTQSPGPCYLGFVCVAGLLFHWGNLPEARCLSRYQDARGRYALLETLEVIGFSVGHGTRSCASNSCWTFAVQALARCCCAAWMEWSHSCFAFLGSWGCLVRGE